MINAVLMYTKLKNMLYLIDHVIHCKLSKISST